MKESILSSAGSSVSTRACMLSWLTSPQVDGMLIRRDLIIKHFDKLIGEKGEAAVLFP